MKIRLDSRRVLILILLTTLLSLFYYFECLTVRNGGLAIGFALILWVATVDGIFEKCYVICKTFPRDATAIKLFLTFRYELFWFFRNNGNVPQKFRERVQRHPDKICFIADDRRWTFRNVDQASNQVANVFQAAGLTKGDVVALYMESTPDFVCIWLGLAKIGVITALINNNLRFQSFEHTVTTSNAKVLIFSTHLGEAVVEILSLLQHKIDYYYYGTDENRQFPFAQSLNDAMAATKPDPPAPTTINTTDHLLYIYTSGTTGLPKAAVITNSRFYYIVAALNTVHRPDDIVYVNLPIYHTAGGIMGVGQALCCGLTVYIKKKFSASQFWTDCIQHNCTVTQYLGETCRYVLAQPPKPQDRAHSIRLMTGSGLRAQIWEQFVNRFGVKIIEVYGSTEGNANIVNIDGTIGAVGFIPSVLSNLLPMAVIKVDEDTGKPLRNEKGLCIQCKRGQSGEFVGKISDSSPERKFDGYLNKESTSKKIYHDVITKGDSVFASGDILVMDRFGYLFFKDRMGDTFRWKSENVSTNEVEGVISRHVGLQDSVVYGVQVPNCEGRAGMAAIMDPTNSLDLDKLYQCLARELPAYARPLFIRIADALQLTGTFKLKKVDLQNDGFDPEKCGDHKLYYLKGTEYSVLTDDVYRDICDGKIRY